MNNPSVFKSDFLTRDPLVPAFVFHRESQRLTRLHQTSIGINCAVKGFFDNQRAAIRRFQNILDTLIPAQTEEYLYGQTNSTNDVSEATRRKFSCRSLPE